VTSDREDGPGSIVGMSGLLVGLGDRRGLATAGLLGTTSGYHVDPASARAVLEALQAAFDFEVALETLDEQAERMQALLEQLQTGQPTDQAGSQGGEDLRYFG
jgi:proteasome assembly chaperone (PAC2) family protein